MKDKVDKLPTIMNFKDELDIIKQVMLFNIEHIMQHQQCMVYIIEALHISYIDNGYMEVAEENIVLLNKFSRWLKNMIDKGIDIHPFIVDDFLVCNEEIVYSV